jgi:hypothetical protein
MNLDSKALLGRRKLERFQDNGVPKLELGNEVRSFPLLKADAAARRPYQDRFATEIRLEIAWASR